MSESETICWYDLETFGINPAYDRIAQFACVRTNTDLQIIEDPIILYCRITDDYIPDPLACLITGITPQMTLQRGLNEYEFITRILDEFSRPMTCVAGFNSIRFDDEFIRNALYRNFYDPYTREYARGNSRWDIIDLLRAAHDLRPEGIEWPTDETGRPTFRLQALTEANDISHESAHDALADVFATIEMARLVRKAQPDLYKFAYEHRTKNSLKKLVDIFQQRPIVHVASTHTTEHGCSALVMPLSIDPQNSSTVICFDLMKDPEPIIEGAPDSLFQQGSLTRIALNRCPFIAPASTLTPGVRERLGIDWELCMEHHARMRERHDVPNKIRSALGKFKNETIADPDFQIYSGGFFSDADKERFSRIHLTPPEKLLDTRITFDDPRVPEMLWRFVARNYPQTLGEQDLRRWKSFAASRLLFPPGGVLVDFHFYQRKIAEKGGAKDISGRDKLILKALADHGEELERRLFSANT